MALEQILSVSGKPGLYKLVGQLKNGIIVESIGDGKRFPIHGSSKVSALEEISIYTHEEEVALNEVFKRIFEKEGGKTGPDHKCDQKEIKAYFESILPEYDPDRVYVSDMVKVVKWYNILVENKMYDPAELKEEAEDAAVEAKDAPKKADAKKTKGGATKAKPQAKQSAPKSAAKSKSTASSPRKAGGAQRGN